MKLAKRITPLVLLFALLTAATAQELEYTAVDSSKLWFDGTSTLHDFTCYAREIKAQVSFSPSLLNGQPGSVQNGEVIIPVKQIKHKDEGLNKNMYKTLAADKYPDIKFVWNSILVEENQPADSVIDAKIDGALTVRGERRDITVPVKINGLDSADTLNVVGDYALSLANFGIKRPSFFLGTLKVGDEIDIHFDMTFARSNRNKELTQR